MTVISVKLTTMPALKNTVISKKRGRLLRITHLTGEDIVMWIRGGGKSTKWILILEIAFPNYPPYCCQRYDALGGVFIVEKCPGDVIGLREWGPTQFKCLVTVPLRHVRSIMERLVNLDSRFYDSR